MSPGKLTDSPSPSPARPEREKREREPATEPAVSPMPKKAAATRRVSNPVRRFVAEPAQQAPTVVTDASAVKPKPRRKSRAAGVGKAAVEPGPAATRTPKIRKVGGAAGKAGKKPGRVSRAGNAKAATLGGTVGWRSVGRADSFEARKTLGRVLVAEHGVTAFQAANLAAQWLAFVKATPPDEAKALFSSTGAAARVKPGVAPAPEAAPSTPTPTPAPTPAPIPISTPTPTPAPAPAPAPTPQQAWPAEVPFSTSPTIMALAPVTADPHAAHLLQMLLSQQQRGAQFNPYGFGGLGQPGPGGGQPLGFGGAPPALQQLQRQLQMARYAGSSLY